MNQVDKIEKVKAIFDNLNIVDITKKKIDSYLHNAINCLNKISTTKKDALNYFVELLDKREV